MFHSTISPRDKYLSALAEAKAAEAEYLAAERLQQEEESLRQRLSQIQLLKHRNTTTPAPQSLFVDNDYAHLPLTHPGQIVLGADDLHLLRRQIAEEQRAVIAREQQQAQRLEALRKQQQVIEAQRKQQQQARELEALRLYETHKAQAAARDIERTRALAAQRAHFANLTQRTQEQPVVQFLYGGEPVAPQAPRKQHHCRQKESRSELPNTLDLTDLLRQFAAAPAQVQKETKPEPTVAVEDILSQLLGARPRTQQAQPTAPTAEDVLNRLFGARAAAPAPKPQPTAAPQAVDLQQLINHVLGAAGVAHAPAAPQQAKAPEPEAAQVPVSLEQLINHFLGAAGVQQAPSATPSASAPAPQAKPEVKAEPAVAEKKETQPQPKKQDAAAPVSQTPVGFEQIINHFLGAAGQPSASTSAAAPNQDGFQQLLNMFMGGHPHHQHSQKAQESAQASSSKSASAESALKQELEARLRTQQSSEERDLEEAIRMSLADSAAAPASHTDSKGKAPAPPAPVKDVTTSAAEVRAIDSSFTSLASEFVFPAQLEFSTSRTASPSRAGVAEAESATSRLSYSAHNQPVRFYHQALNGLLGQLDAVDSFGDDALRHQRKDVVGRVEGALDELEQLIEARWRKFAGKEERKEEQVVVPTTEPQVEVVPAEATPTATTDAAPAPESPVVVAAEVEEASEVVASDNSASDEAVSDAAPVTATTDDTTTAAPESAASSYPPTPSPAESDSVETIRGYDVSSPAPSDIDTFLLPATSSEEKPPVKHTKAEAEDVGSDWSEVDA
ncbi:hypothetical protein C8J57DRAFT_1704462 [Mycena rebaudengoi]|nr:hypothetical protein C8J57DRAFT_1704462 [Mycena rebaudengoi]